MLEAGRAMTQQLSAHLHVGSPQGGTSSVAKGQEEACHWHHVEQEHHLRRHRMHRLSSGARERATEVVSAMLVGIRSACELVTAERL